MHADKTTADEMYLPNPMDRDTSRHTGSDSQEEEEEEEEYWTGSDVPFYEVMSKANLVERAGQAREPNQFLQSGLHHRPGSVSSGGGQRHFTEHFCGLMRLACLDHQQTDGKIATV